MIRIENLPRHKGATEAQRRAKMATANALFAPSDAGRALNFNRPFGATVNPASNTSLTDCYIARRSDRDVARRQRDGALAELMPAVQAYDAPLTLFERQVLDQVHRAGLRYGAGNWFNLPAADVADTLKGGATADMVRQAMAKLIVIGAIAQLQNFGMAAQFRSLL